MALSEKINTMIHKLGLALETPRHIKQQIDEWLKTKGAGYTLGEINLPPHRWIVAIDFGTDGTGFAYADKKSKDIFVNRIWGDGPTALHKTKTSVLLDAHGTCLAFGSHAEAQYITMEPTCANQMFFFQSFKMAIFSTWLEKSLSKKTVLIASNGFPMSAQTVFSAALRYIKQCLQETISRGAGHELQTSDVLYVLTVPAIWNDAAKQFMRECAYEAGLVSRDDPNRLFLALEPEAAGIYCRTLPAAGFVRKRSTKQVTEPMPGDSYVVVDAGGGTVDIVVHKIDTMGNIREIYQASGGPWGGNLCNQKFLGLLEDIFGKDVVEYVKKHTPSGHAEMMKIIEDAKRAWLPSSENSMRIRLNMDFREGLEELGKSAKSTVKRYAELNNIKVEYTRETLVLPSDTVKHVLDQVTDTIVNHILDILKQPKVKGASRMFLVGGFSECQHLQNCITNTFGTKLQVLIPTEGGVAVLRGAVMFGRNPTVVQQRVAKYSFGFGNAPEFNASRHRLEKRICYDGVDSCADVFESLIKTGEAFKVGHTVRRMGDPPAKAQTKVRIDLYYGPGEPQYTTDEGVKRLGSVEIIFPAAREDSEENRIDQVYCFGLTEVHVLLIHRASGNCVSDKFDFLSDGGV